MLLSIIFLLKKFDCINKEQSISLKPGIYQFECWGAQGNGAYHYISSYKKTSDGGKGAYTKGIISINKETKFSIFVGGKGTLPYARPDEIGSNPVSNGGFNGGGDSGNDIAAFDTDGAYIAGGGGGATDIRISDNKCESRIMVAAGGSGGAVYANGAPGGNTTGMSATGFEVFSISKSTTQTKGGRNGQGFNGHDNYKMGGSGGGGGYFGGVAPTIDEDKIYAKNEQYQLIADSGSSLINLSFFTVPLYVVGVREGNGTVKITSCPDNCGSCNDDGTCSSCTNYYLLLDGICYKDCPNGTYPTGKPKDDPSSSPNGRKCLPCPENCLRCSSLSCIECKDSYFRLYGKCYSNCSDANNENKKFGIDKSSIKQCKNCNVPDCDDCWSDYTKCDKCKDPYIFDSKTQKCIEKPTDLISESKIFSISKFFSASNFFSKSTDFTKSNNFIPTSVFSQSSDFSKSSKFVPSLIFSNSFYFTKSKNFAPSSQFSNSNKFSKSFFFSLSDKFSSTDLFSFSSIFSNTVEFSDTNKFSESILFTFSNQFSESRKFDKTQIFSSSEKFSSSFIFSLTTVFTASGEFSETFYFSMSGEFTRSNKFSESLHFSESEKFSNSKEFSKTAHFSLTSKFTNTGEFSKTFYFSMSGEFSKSNKFIESHCFSSSEKFSETAHFTESSKFTFTRSFSGTQFFTSSQEFSQTRPFSGTEKFTSTRQFSDSWTFRPTQKPFPDGDVCGVLDENRYSLLGVCDYTARGARFVYVYVLADNFTNYKQKGSGSAVHVINCGLRCNNTNFVNCISTSGGGGAVYMSNTLSMTNNATFIDTNFSHCRAMYGGAIFLLSSTENFNVTITKCVFKSNQALQNSPQSSNEDRHLFGGQALYMMSMNFHISKCIFEKNSGPTSAIKVYNVFGKKLKNVQLENLGEEREGSLSIVECDFVQNGDSKNLIYYADEKSNRIKVVDCMFKGKIKKGAHYINVMANINDVQLIRPNNFENSKGDETKISLKAKINSNFSQLLIEISLLLILFSLIAMKLVHAYYHQGKKNDLHSDEMSDNSFNYNQCY